MSNIIRISRNAAAEPSREHALIALSNTSRIKHYAGQLVMSKYYTDYDNLGIDSPMDTVIVIGVSEGYGSDHYRVISLGANKIIRGFRQGSSDIPDVSECVHDEVWLWEDDEGKFYFVYNTEINSEGIYESRTIVSIGDGPYHFENAEDNSNWYFYKGVMRADYDYYTQDETDSLLSDLNLELTTTINELRDYVNSENSDQNDWLTEIDNETFPLSLKIICNTTQYVVGETCSPILSISAYRKSIDVSEDCIFYVEGEEIELTTENQYTLDPAISENTIVTFSATYTPRGIGAISTVTFDFGRYFWYGLIPEFEWEISEENIMSLTKSQVTPSTSSYIEVSNIISESDKRYAFISPTECELLSIMDDNGFNIIQDFIKEDISLTILGKTMEYYVYIKKSAAVFEDTKLTFNY